MKTNVGLMVQDQGSSMASLIGVWLNNRYRDVVNSYTWEQLYITQTITTSANVSSYPFDANTDKIIFVNDITNSGTLNITTEEQFLQQNFDDLTTTGTPTTCFIKSDVVSSQPGSAEQITVKSSSTLDAIIMLIRGITSTGGETYENLTTNGTTVVTASNSYTRILGISKAEASVGKITMYENDEATSLAEIYPENLESRYKTLDTHPIPSGTATIHIRTKRRISPLAQNYDYPVIEDVSDVIELGAQADAWRYKKQFNKGSILESQYQITKDERIFREVNQPGLIHQMVATPLNRDEGII